MVNRLQMISVVVLAASVCCPGCSYMSRSSRQQMAYQHYVRKNIRQREKALAKAQKKASRQLKKNMQIMPVDNPKMTATVEPVADPITVSSSSGSDNAPAPPQP